MSFFYFFSLHCYSFFIWIASPFNKKAKSWIIGRKKSFPKLEDDEVISWFHCASLGEFDQGLPLMWAWKEKHPNEKILVTFFSPSGMENYNKRNHPVDYVVYLPLDTKVKAEAFIQHFKPKNAFFVKYEYWYNHLNEAKKSGCCIYGVCSLFRPEHRFFKKTGAFYRKSLYLFNHFFVQNKTSETLLHSIGIHDVTLVGDTRYDRMIAFKRTVNLNAKLNDFKSKSTAPILILGSSWPVDIEQFGTFFLDWIKNGNRIIIAPHSISTNNLSVYKVFFKDKLGYFSKGELNNAVLLIDTIGILTAAYQYADIAYVGGGFTGKLHNILEPGVFKLPILIGPKCERFPEALLFEERGVLKRVQTALQFEQNIHHLLNEKPRIESILENIFDENAGAVNRIIDTL